MRRLSILLSTVLLAIVPVTAQAKKPAGAGTSEAAPGQVCPKAKAKTAGKTKAKAKAKAKGKGKGKGRAKAGGRQRKAGKAAPRGRCVSAVAREREKPVSDDDDGDFGEDDFVDEVGEDADDAPEPVELEHGDDDDEPAGPSFDDE